MIERNTGNLVQFSLAQRVLLLCAFCYLALGGVGTAHATPVVFYQSFAGNLDYVVTGGSLRTGNCTVTGSSTSALSGIPATATITAAYLYWGGSDTNPQTLAGSSVTFEGSTVIPVRNFSEPDPIDPMFWFGGFADVTAAVLSKRNGSYTFSGLTVETGGLHCTYNTVLAAWGMVVIYEDAAEPLRVLNLFDGMQVFWGSATSLTPNNFVIPSSGIDGKFAVLSWEGDSGNSGTRNGFSEDLIFDGQNTAPVTLEDLVVNFAGNQYNSTINTITPNSNHLGVDFDVYDISAQLRAGDTQATTIYSAGQDLVLLGLEILSVTNTPVADLAISKTHSGDFTSGQQGVYTISVSNNGPNDETNTITVTDTLVAGLSYVSATGTGWTCGAVGQDVTCTHAGPLANGNSLPDITLTVDVTATANFTNSATVSSSTFDNVAANNTSDDATTVIVPNLSGSSKSVSDTNGGDADPGDTLRYTITIVESAGGDIDSVAVTDTIDALFSSYTVVSIPTGATDNSNATTLDISNISVSGGGSVSIVFDAVIDNAANPGDTITNTAVINNPVTATNTNASAPSVVVSISSIPGSGVKPLYFYMVNAGPPDTNTLQRVPNPSNTNSGDIAIGNTYSAVLSPSLQASMTLQAGNIPIQLWLRRRIPNGSGSRDVTVSLDYFATGPGGSNGSLGSHTQFGILNSSPWQLIVFNINLAAPVTLNANTAIRFNLTNEPSSGGQVRARTLVGGGNPTRSIIFLNSDTVINVDSVIDVDNVAYPGGTTQPSYVPTETLRVRAVVSDPFGHDDITSATIEILDPSSTSVVPANTPMTEVAPLAPGTAGSTKTYEYIFTVPGGGPNGIWTARVTAIEGQEGTISDLGVDTFLVGVPSISVTKLATTISDPVNNPSYPNPDAGENPLAIPNAIVQYQLQVTNSGVGRTDNNSIVITDALSSNSSFYFGNPIAPITFNDGTAPLDSGLTFTFIDLANTTDDIDFSNDGGATFITPLVDANGFDITNPLINYIRIQPKGRLNGNIGNGNPNFTIIFKVRVK